MAADSNRKRKARDRTRAWRRGRQAASTAEAREIDRAIVAALIHVVVHDAPRGMIPKATLLSIVQVATFILEIGKDRTHAMGAVEDRIRSLGSLKEVARAREREASRRTEE